MTKDIETLLRDSAAAAPPTGFEATLAERAAAEGLLDVAYAKVDSPVGPLLVASTPRGLVRVAYTDWHSEDDVLADMARRLSPRMLEAPARLDEERRELDEYFAGRRTEFELPVDVVFDSFRLRVMDELARIPYGSVTTYGALAAKAGNPRAARAVGMFMNRNPIPIVLPCHRVVGASGSLVGYGGGLERKERLLQLEGASLTLPV
jgi:methylated-DNA-[protein]-cysteine S-methyltransferase